MGIMGIMGIMGRALCILPIILGLTPNNVSTVKHHKLRPLRLPEKNRKYSSEFLRKLGKLKWVGKTVDPLWGNKDPLVFPGLNVVFSAFTSSSVTSIYESEN